MAPPITPSPHRFLTGQRRDPSPTKAANPPAPPSIPYARPSVEQHATQATWSSQFMPAPRFGKAKRPTQRPQSPSKPVIVQALRTSLRATDAVEDTPEQPEDEEMLDTERVYAIPTTENDTNATAWTNDVALSPKRRRLDAEEGFSSPGRHVLKQPHTTASHFAKAMPRVLPSQMQGSNATQTSAPSVSRPAFLRSSVAPSEPGEPLPDAFSPHRRGQKYIPGGMAETMQQWVMEAGQAAVQSRKGQGYLKGEDYVIHAKVESLGDDGPNVAKAKMPNGETIKLVMAGTAHTGAVRQQNLAIGSTIGIRAPVWDIELTGSEYVVAVDWKVLP